MSTYGRQVFTRTGFGIQVSADGNPTAKLGGITVEWAAIPAAAADYEVRPNGELVDTNFLSNASPADDYVYAGKKFLRYGTVMCKLIGGTSAGKYVPYGSSTGLGGGTISTASGDWVILNSSKHEEDYHSDHPQAIVGGQLFKHRLLANFAKSQTVAISGTPSAGAFTLTYKGVTTGNLAYNVTTTAVQTALEGLTTIGAGNVTVTGTAGQSYVIVLADGLGVHETITLAVTTPFSAGSAISIAATSGTIYGPTDSEFRNAFPSVTYVND